MSPIAQTPADRPAAQTAWLQHLSDLTQDEGYLEPLGARHHAYFRDAGPKLLVSFTPLEQLAAQSPGLSPASWALAEARGWSHLSILSEGPGWYRDAGVWRHFDRLIDDGFFEDFDSVLFYGAGAAAHAACAYSVAAPGATVVALAPVATLWPQLAGWDQRWPELRRLDFRSRFGYGPDMIEGAERVYLLFDPEIPEDAMHAALYRHPLVTRLPARGAGRRPELLLEQSDLLAELLEQAEERRLTAAGWYKMWRARRDNPAWLQNRAARAAAGETPRREATFLALLLKLQPDQHRLRRRYEQLMSAMGIPEDAL